MTKEEAKIKNDLMLRLSGVDLFHSKGFNGEGITIVTLETAGSDHSITPTQCAKTFAPNAVHYCMDATEENFMKCIENKVDIISVSMGFMNQAGSKKAAEAGIVVFGAIGNDGYEADFATWDHVIKVGVLWEHTLEVANFSTKSEFLDLVFFIPYVEGSDNYWFQRYGTSFASPSLAGACGPLLQYWKSIGYKYTSNDVKKYLYKHAVDVLQTGRDNASGQGYARIDFMNTIKAQIDKNELVVNGAVKPIGLKPNGTPLPGARLIEGSTMVPFRAIGDAIESIVKDKTVLSYKTDWDATTKTAIYFIDTK